MAGHRGELTINCKALADNYHLVDSLSTSSCNTAPAVKANGYGLGAVEVSKVFYESGARQFFVATLDEAIELRKGLSDVDIYLLNGFVNAEYSDFCEYRLAPVLNSLPEIEEYKGRAHEGDVSLPALLHIDTGMNRLGLRAQDVEVLQQDHSLLRGIDFKYVMSHFTSSEESQNPSNEKQYKAFDRLSQTFGVVPKSLCNSGGIFASKDYHFDLTRPGISLYGGCPTDTQDVNPMSQVVSIHVPILQIKPVKKGECAGYNETHRFDDDTNVAVISLGYADGIFRVLGDHGVLYYKNYCLPICGRISMDLIICDLSNVPVHEMPSRGDMIEVIGAHQTIDDLAKAAGTISYEVLTSLGARYQRSYIK